MYPETEGAGIYENPHGQRGSGQMLLHLLSFRLLLLDTNIPGGR